MKPFYFLSLTIFFIVASITLGYCRSLHSFHHQRNKNNIASKDSLKIVSMADGFDPGFNLDFISVLNDATNVFRNIIWNIVSKKKLMGIESPWYWT